MVVQLWADKLSEQKLVMALWYISYSSINTLYNFKVEIRSASISNTCEQAMQTFGRSELQVQGVSKTMSCF